MIIRLSFPYFLNKKTIVIENLPLVELPADSVHSAKTFRADQQAGVKGKASLFVFDPNTVTHHQLLSLGLKDKTAATFIKFRSKGFRFRKKEDLKKVFGISESMYQRLEAYILIHSPAESNSKQEKFPEAVNAGLHTSAKAPQQKLELNSADSSALVELNGIGPAFARKIVKYRSLLGGYHSILQLKEVYGFTEEMYERLSPLFTVDASLIKKLNINSDDFKTVNRHPYLDYEQTKRIFELRRHKALDTEDMRLLLNDETNYKKLLPYLAF